MKVRIGLVGDYTPDAKAHQAIPIALALAGAGYPMPCEFEWIHTSTLLDDPGQQLGHFQGIWCVPATPYANTRGAVGAVRFAREAGRPFLGTCGGFQHALLECAESLW